MEVQKRISHNWDLDYELLLALSRGEKNVDFWIKYSHRERK